MVYSTTLRMTQCASTLTPVQRKKLLELCVKYQKVFNAGERPLTATKLVTFEMETPEVDKPISVPPRPLSHAKREAAAKINLKTVRAFGNFLVLVVIIDALLKTMQEERNLCKNLFHKM